jgi:peptidoglycan/LPS O-acetylase OafA/YrhL
MSSRAKHLKAGCTALLAGLAIYWCCTKLVDMRTYSVFWRISLVMDWRQGASWGVAFFAGSCLYLYRSRVPRSIPLALALCLVCALRPPIWASVQVWLVVPYCVFVAAYELPELFRRIGKRTDLSYVIYIYAFPVQQTVSALLVPRGAAWATTLFVSLIFTLILAWLSWTYVERPALALKSRLGKAKRAAASPLITVDGA